MSAPRSRHRCPVPIGEADVGPRQRRRVVDAVAHHADDVALGLERRPCRPCPGEHFGEDVVHADLGSDGLGGAPVVARHHHDTQTQRVQAIATASLDVGGRGRRRRADARLAPVDRDEHGRAPSAGELCGIVRERDCVRRELQSSRPALPISTTRPSTTASTPCPTIGVELRGFAERDSASAARTIAAASGCSLRRSAEAASRRSSVVSANPARHDVGQGGLALGDRAGLVEDDGRELVRGFERLAALDEDAQSPRRALFRP
jgi:hypothetical protein